MGIPTPARIVLSVPFSMTSQMERLVTGLPVLAGLLIFFLTTIVALCKIRLNRKEREIIEIRQYLNDVRALADSLEAKQRKSRNIIEQQRVRIKHLEEDLVKMREQYLSMYRDQFLDISRLLDSRVFSLTQNRSDQVLAKRVDLILERIKGGSDGLGELVNSINRHFDNILVHLQDDIPQLSNTDFKLFCYYCAGFPPEQIYLLLGMKSISILYLRKKRLSDKIRVLNSEYRPCYLLLLDVSRLSAAWR